MSKRQVRKPTKKFHVTTSEGALFEADTIEDLNKLLLNSVNEGTRTIRDREEQLRRSNITRTRSRRDSNDDKSSKRPNKFNRDDWFKLMDEDPIEGLKEILPHVFGTKDPVASLEFASDVARATSERVAGAEFLQSRPDFPANSENAQRLMNYVTEHYIETGREDRITSRVLSDALDDMIADGRLRPLSPEEQKAAADTGVDDKDGGKEDKKDDVIPGSPEDRSGGQDDTLEGLDMSEDDLMGMDEEKFQEVLKQNEMI